MNMKKSEMISKLLRHNGVGVRVTTITGYIDYLFYEDFTDEEDKVNDGISRAYKHFSHGEQLVFYSNKWAKQITFKHYLKHYFSVEKNAMLYPYDNAVQEKCDQFLDFLVKTLIQYTGFSARKAKRQILCNSVSFNKFKEKVV